MKIYWSNNSVPELQGLDKHKQLDLRFRAVKANRHNPRLWLGLVAVFSVYLGILAFLLYAIPFSGIQILIQITLMLLFHFWFNQYLIWLIRPHLRLYRLALDKTYSNDDDDYFVPPAY
ncbi:MAG TPA: hypothetical protein DEF47_23435 [Herpetosiphon sp.]|uniref:Uncharacterized protein n=1 Tax=Herpetosiphon aurantiacus (strain ATCC 23779 / DSM 785 / 114-95) TaxID=316274 RepID=A9B2L3_HERA2|nr:hypothetical protein [Herpetosiphon sp.]ABX05464.1 hypothetical protein Haur_2826 [Herpetosiphon aurantiacus DSM 785]HBW52846.1 hypothetical protein [Herpetosiphon sp.]